MDIARRSTRGGNWPDREGGPPRVLIVAVETETESAADLLQKIGRVKADIRSAFDRGTLRSSPNVLHSSDDETHAAHYIKLIVPEQYGEICRRADFLKGLEARSRQPERSGLPQHGRTPPGDA